MPLAKIPRLVNHSVTGSTLSVTSDCHDVRMEEFRFDDGPDTSPDVDDDFEPHHNAEVIGLPDNRYLDRELSWLAFNQRVLELAEDPETPLLERANFLAIFASNLDEFFMVRVAGLKRRILTGLAVPTNIGRSPLDVLADISRRAHELQERHAGVFQREVGPALAQAGIHFVSWDSLDDADRAQLDTYFTEQIFPVLMPLAVDPAHPFPYISGLSLNLAIRVRNGKTGTEEFARLKVPQMLPRFVRVDAREDLSHVRFIPLEDLIANHLGELFPGMEVLEHHVFRVTRNEDVEIDEDETENLIQVLEKGLLRRRFGPPIRLEIGQSMDALTLDLLVRELDITEQEVYRLPEPLSLGGLFEISGLKRADLHYAPHVPVTSANLLPEEAGAPSSIFASIRRGDILLHHPYESFSTSVQAFLEQAAADPKVLAIKQTLYRTSGDSPIVQALISAAEAGKQVLALVEIKARFDEQANITWARKLEKAGVHVVYGLVGLKTHCKLALVIRQEDGELKHYSHVGTGNYNPKTSRLYEDLGLLTADPAVGRDLTRLFNELSGYAIEKKFQRLLVAPLHLRKGLLKHIDQEIANARKGLPSGIRIKINSMVDEAIIDGLYRASQAGVPVEVWVRGICGLKAGIPGYSENIRVRSILGRYLEHSRIFMFVNNGDPAVYIGSADMMHRNLDRRVEALVHLTEPAHIAELDELFGLAMSDATSSWWLEADSTWTRHTHTPEGVRLIDLQDAVMAQISRRRRVGGQR
jgi:polyphosphate kinase